MSAHTPGAARRGLPDTGKRVVFGLAMLALAGLLVALSWHALPDGAVSIRLPGRGGGGPRLGQVPALDHVLALAYFAFASLVYTLLALVLRSRFPVDLAALPAAGAFAATCMLTGLVAEHSASDGFAITMAALWAPVSSAFVLLFGYAVEGLTANHVLRRRGRAGRKARRRRIAATPPLPPAQRLLFTALGLVGAAAALGLLVVAVVAASRERMMLVPFVDDALPAFSPVTGWLAASLLLVAAVIWCVALRPGGLRSPRSLIAPPVAAALGAGFLVLGAMTRDTGIVEILVGFTAITVSATAAGAIGWSASARSAVGQTDPSQNP